MDYDERTILVNQVFNVLDSLTRAFNAAGGEFKIDNLSNMSVIELIQVMALNNLRFLHVGSRV